MLSRIVKCNDCNKVLNEKDAHADFTNCEYCGSTNINYLLSFNETINFHENIRGKVKEEGYNRPRKEFFYGNDLNKSKNEWVDKQRVIDRENNNYLEKVIEPKTGELIHECNEPLSQHFGHGSAKFKKNE